MRRRYLSMPYDPRCERLWKGNMVPKGFKTFQKCAHQRFEWTVAQVPRTHFFLIQICVGPICPLYVHGISGQCLGKSFVIMKEIDFGSKSTFFNFVPKVAGVVNLHNGFVFYTKFWYVNMPYKSRVWMGWKSNWGQNGKGGDFDPPIFTHCATIRGSPGNIAHCPYRTSDMNVTLKLLAESKQSTRHKALDKVSHWYQKGQLWPRPTLLSKGSFIPSQTLCV
jgi:hypothetical protein